MARLPLAKTPYQDAMNYFEGAPEAIIKLAKAEAFQYVLENIAGEIKPRIPDGLFHADNLKKDQCIAR